MNKQIAGRFAVNLVESSENELLFLKRSEVNRIAVGLWGFPAGHIESGETPQMCSSRELREEIGNDVEVSLLNTHGPVLDHIDGRIYAFYLFHYRWNSGSIELNEEHTEYAWVNRENYRTYSVMRGVDIDIDCFNIWPRRYLNTDLLRD